MERGTPIANLRGLGAMLGVRRREGARRHEPDGPTAKRAAARALERGLIVLTCGTFGKALRILVPLTIPEGELHAGLDIALRRHRAGSVDVCKEAPRYGIQDYLETKLVCSEIAAA